MQDTPTTTPDTQAQINDIYGKISSLQNSLSILTSNTANAAAPITPAPAKPVAPTTPTTPTNVIRDIKPPVIPAYAQPNFVKNTETEAVTLWTFLRGKKTYLISIAAPLANIVIQYYMTGKVDPNVLEIYTTASAALAALRAAIAKIEVSLVAIQTK